MKALWRKCFFNLSPARIDVVNFGKSAIFFIMNRPVGKVRVEYNGQKEHLVSRIGISVVADESGVVPDVVDYIATHSAVRVNHVAPE